MYSRIQSFTKEDLKREKIVDRKVKKQLDKIVREDKRKTNISCFKSITFLNTR